MVPRNSFSSETGLTAVPKKVTREQSYKRATPIPYVARAICTNKTVFVSEKRYTLRLLSLFGVTYRGAKKWSRK